MARLLPWFVTARLEPAEAARVESHLLSCAACRRDVEQQRTLGTWIRGDSRDEPTAWQPSFEKLMSRIDATERAMQSPALPAGAVPVTHRARVPRWLVAAVVLQAIGLGILGSVLWQRSDETLAAQYRTLSSPPVAPGTFRPQIRVVFAPATTVREVADVLGTIGARIVDGPSPSGAYSLALSRPRPSADLVGTSIARLRADSRVVFAEPIMVDGGSSP
jgi:hypothetical protein